MDDETSQEELFVVDVASRVRDSEIPVGLYRNTVEDADEYLVIGLVLIPWRYNIGSLPGK